MDALLKQESPEVQKALEELCRELDKGIRDLEAGRVIPHEEAMRQIYEELGLPYV